MVETARKMKSLEELIAEELEDIQNEEMFSSPDDDPDRSQVKNQQLQALLSALDNVLIQFDQIESRSLTETDKNLLHNYIFKGFMPAYRRLMRGGVMEFDLLRQKINSLIRETFQESKK